MFKSVRFHLPTEDKELPTEFYPKPNKTDIKLLTIPKRAEETALSTVSSLNQYDNHGVKYLPRNVGWIPEINRPSPYLNGPMFCYIGRKNKQVHSLLSCRDYLGDMAFLTVRKNGILCLGGFNYKPDNPTKVLMKKIKILYADQTDKVLHKSVVSGLDLIHQAEKDFGIRRSFLRRVRNELPQYQKTGMYVFTGSGDWMTSPVMLSLYLLLIRISSTHEVGRPWTETVEKVGLGELTPSNYTDRGICNVSVSGISRLIKEGWRNVLGTDLKKNYPGKVLVYGQSHSNFGISAFSQGLSKPWCGHWHQI